MKVYRQGDLDGMCGIYSVLNAIKVIKGLDESDAQALYSKMLDCLNNDKKIHEVLVDGISSTVIAKLLKEIIMPEKLITRWGMPFRKKLDISLDKFWKVCREFLSYKSNVIILSLAGRWDHWSVIHRMTDKRIYLVDSRDMQFINRKNCTTKDYTEKRCNVICPTTTFFLS